MSVITAVIATINTLFSKEIELTQIDQFHHRIAQFLSWPYVYLTIDLSAIMIPDI